LLLDHVLTYHWCTWSKCTLLPL